VPYLKPPVLRPPEWSVGVLETSRNVSSYFAQVSNTDQMGVLLRYVAEDIRSLWCPGDRALRRGGQPRRELRRWRRCPPVRVTEGEFLARWPEASVKLITYEGYSVLTRRHLIPPLERHMLEELTPGHVGKYRSNKLNKERSAALAATQPP
jgi:hypothetical protein